MRAFVKVIEAFIGSSQSARDVVVGIGSAFDPAPHPYVVFYDSDAAAFVADNEALYLDWCHVRARLVDLTQTHLGEKAHHHGGTTVAKATIAARQLAADREHA